MNFYISAIFYDVMIWSEDMKFLSLDLEYSLKIALLFVLIVVYPQQLWLITRYM